MDVLQEIFLTAFFSLVFAFLLAKLVSTASDSDKETEAWKQTATVDDVPTTVGERIFGRAMEGVPATVEGGQGGEVEVFELAKKEKEALRFGEIVYERVREATEAVVVRELPEFGPAAGVGCGSKRVLGGEGAEEEKDGIFGRESPEEEKVVVGDHASELSSSSSDGIGEQKLALEEQTKEVGSLHRLLTETEESGEKSAAREVREIGVSDVCKEEAADKQPNVRRQFDSEPPKEAEDDDKGREEESQTYAQGGGISDEDDWEGIERSEVSKLFSVAETFIASPSGSEMLSKLENDVQLQLYGLHKAATEGPCYESSPSALKPGARAKWNVWQKLGNMNPEMAMEQYIALLSESIPQWRALISMVNQEYDGGVVRPQTIALVLTAPDSSSLAGQGANLDAHSDGGTDSCELKFTEANSHMDPPEHVTVDSSSV